MVKLFDIHQDGRFTPTEDVLGMNSFKNIFDEFGENSGKVLAYIHYMKDLNPATNPYANLSEEIKQEVIIRQTCPELDIIENITVEDALELVEQLYETDGYKMYKAFKSVWDKTAKMLYEEEMSMGVDGNAKDVQLIVKNYKDLRESLKLALQDFQDELGIISARGGRERNKYSGKNKELD